jgi:hypothetical protein
LACSSETCSCTSIERSKAANELKLATGPYKAARDVYVAATATYTNFFQEHMSKFWMT